MPFTTQPELRMAGVEFHRRGLAQHSGGVLSRGSHAERERDKADP